MTRYTVLLLLAAILLTTSIHADAEGRWWYDGHAHITRHAPQHMPSPVRGFFENNAEYIANISGQEPPGKHYIDIDAYPEFFAGTFPHDLEELIAMYGASFVYDQGTAPWTVGDYAEDLTVQMRDADSAADWRALRQTAGQLAHYIADLHNPLHLTLNYNGQLTGNYGIHARYEGNMIDWHLPHDLPIVAQPDQCNYHLGIIDAVFDSIDVNYWYVGDIMAADDAAVAIDPDYGWQYYNILWQHTGSFTQVLYQDASELIASAWYTAWIDAGSPLPIPAPMGYELLDYCLAGPGIPVQSACNPSDEDGDGDVDVRDWSLMQIAGR